MLIDHENASDLGLARHRFVGFGASLPRGGGGGLWFGAARRFCDRFVNLIVRPALVVLTLPVTFFTLGLFLFVINALLFWAAASVLEGFEVHGFTSALIGSLLYACFGLVIDLALQGLFPPERL